MRTGRTVGRTLYLQAGDEPSDGDRLIGMMDLPEQATEVVDAVNGVGEAPRVVEMQAKIDELTEKLDGAWRIAESTTNAIGRRVDEARADASELAGALGDLIRAYDDPAADEVWRSYCRGRAVAVHNRSRPT